MRWLIAEHPEFSDLMSVEVLPQTGLKLSPRQGKKTLAERDRSAAQERKLKPDGHLELITVDWTFGTEELSVRSPHLGKLEREPCLLLSIKDASRLGIIDGDKVVVRSDTGTIEACAAVVENMASGTLVLPRHHRLDWQHIEAAKATLSKEQVYSVKEDQ
jgi:anaerobic selenocysteine-containing dehydrogenase